MNYPSIIVLKYALTSGPFLVIPGQAFGEHQCDAVVQIYEKPASYYEGKELLQLQGLDQLPSECGLRVDPQLNGFGASYFYNTKSNVEFVLNNPQGRSLALRVFNNLEIKVIQKFKNQLVPESQHLFDSYTIDYWHHHALQPFRLRQAEAARAFISKLEESND